MGHSPTSNENSSARRPMHLGPTLPKPTHPKGEWLPGHSQSERRRAGHSKDLSHGTCAHTRRHARLPMVFGRKKNLFPSPQTILEHCDWEGIRTSRHVTEEPSSGASFHSLLVWRECCCQSLASGGGSTRSCPAPHGGKGSAATSLSWKCVSCMHWLKEQ